MFNFNEEAVRKEHENGVGIIAKTQEVVDQICKEGFKNIFYIAHIFKPPLYKRYFFNLNLH